MVVDAWIEIPKGSQNKYEHDKESHVIRLDRVLHSSVHYPTDYGYIPGTLAEDGDPLDILVLISVPTFPGCVVEARVLGALSMEDEKGEDTKILAAAVGDPRLNELRSLDDVPAHTRREIEHFFATYKDLEKKWSKVRDWKPLEAAVAEIESARRRSESAQA